jgi:probable rRNA maturation factor
MAIKIDITTEEKLWRRHSLISKKIKSLIKEIILQINYLKDIKNIEISIVLTGNEQIKELNKNYRKKDKPTNVLSFPLLDTKDIKNGNFKNFQNKHPILVLGDIVLSYQTIKKESEEQNKIFDHHLAHLLTHSILHLTGFDHINSKDANTMEDLEIEILEKMKIKNPYKALK